MSKEVCKEIPTLFCTALVVYNINARNVYYSVCTMIEKI